MQNNTIKDVLKVINNCNNVVIAAHTNPDGDAIGASLGLALGLKKLGKNPIVILEPFENKFDVIPGRELIYTGDIKMLKPDTFVALDSGSTDRLGEALFLLETTPHTLNIDHHISNNSFARINYVVADKASTSEIVFDLLSLILEIDKEIGSALYAGMVTDTGGFRHNSTTAKTYAAAAKLLSLNIPFTQIYNKLMYTNTISEARALAEAINHVKTNCGIGFTYLLQDDLIKIGASPRDLSGICEYILTLENVEVSIFVYPKGSGIYKISLRSRGAPVDKIALALGGGGHKLAAGADFSGTFEQAREAVLKHFKDVMKCITEL